MLDPQTSRFWQAAVQSGLIDVGKLKSCWEALPPEKRGADQLDRRLARQAVQANFLTLWQAQQLLAGRSSGFKIDRYVLLAMIGQGGMGRVYLARDSRLNRSVALKILSPERVNNPRAIARFQREARVGAQLQHENLVRIYDEGEANGKCYLVMEYIEGKNIGTIIAENGSVPPSTAARLARQVALGLEHAQQKGLIHRDVNPYNILVTRDGTAKLTDLGLAIDLGDQAPVTRDGATVGTFDYVSPEQARHSHSVDTRSDIYSLGCSIYHMISGQVPFASPSLPEKLFGHQAIMPESLATLVPGVPEGLANVVQKMMAKSPDDRYADPLQVAEALEPFIDNEATGYRDDALPHGTLEATRATQTATRITIARRGPDLPVTEAALPSPNPETAPAAAPLPGATAVAQVEQSAGDSAVGSDLGSGLLRFEKPTSVQVKPKPAAEAATPPPPPRSASSGGQALDLSALGLELDFGPSPSRAEAAAKANAAPAPSPPVPNEKPAAPAPDLTRLAGDVRGVEDASGLGLGLDFSAAQVSSSSANSSASRKSQSPAVASAPSSKAPARGPDRRLLIAGAAFVAIVVAGGLFASGVLGGKPAKTGPARRTQPNDLARQTGPDTTGSDPQYTPTSATTPGPVGLAIPVEAQDGTITNEPDLLNALQRAIGSSGRVLLNNREPIRLSGKDAIVPPVSGGRLYIRAAGGVQPVLEVEVSGKEPFLSTRTRTPITIVGVTIVARYVDQGQPPPPLIEAGAQVTLERCSFRALGAVKGSVAISADGGNLTAAGCWFEGFDKAIDLSVYGEATTRLTHCTIVRPKTDDQPIGWALRVRRQPGSFPKSTRQLTLEHCTFKGEGLLDLIDFSPSTPCKVSINDCAVFADALLAWETSPPGTPLDNQALIWSGTGNQYEIRGKSWVAASSEGTPELTGGPTDLASWMNIGAEHDTIRQPIQFQTDPGALPESPQPSDFAVRAEGNRVVGADPQQVGPPPPKVE